MHLLYRKRNVEKGFPELMDLSGIEGWWVWPVAEEELSGQVSWEKSGTGSLG